MSRARGGTGRSAGFTLIETVVAFAILAVGLGALFRVYGDVLDHDFRAHSQAMAASLAQSLEARLGVDLPVASGSTTGDFDHDFRWQLDISPYGDDGDRAAWPLTPYQVLVTVSWPFGDGRRSITLTTLRLGPKGAPS